METGLDLWVATLTRVRETESKGDHDFRGGVMEGPIPAQSMPTSVTSTYTVVGFCIT